MEDDDNDDDDDDNEEEEASSESDSDSEPERFDFLLSLPALSLISAALRQNNRPPVTFFVMQQNHKKLQTFE